MSLDIFNVAASELPRIFCQKLFSVTAMLKTSLIVAHGAGGMETVSFAASFHLPNHTESTKQ